MNLFSLAINVVCIITFGAQLILSIRNVADKAQRACMAVYFAMLLTNQIGALGIYLARDKEAAFFFINLYTIALSGFYLSFLPLVLSVVKHKKLKPASVLISLVFAAVVILNLLFNSISSIFVGASGYYVPEIRPVLIITNIPSLGILLAGILFTAYKINSNISELTRQRLYYFFTASLCVLAAFFVVLTKLNEYTVSQILMLICGLLLAYAVHQRRLLSIKKTFFRGSLSAILITGATGLYSLILLFSTILTGADFPAFTIFPALLTIAIIVVVVSVNLNSFLGSYIGNIVFPSISIYKKNAVDYSEAVRGLHNFESIFPVLHEFLSKEFEIERFNVFLLNKNDGEFTHVFMRPETDSRILLDGIYKKTPLLLSLKYNDILLPDEFADNPGMSKIGCRMVDIYGQTPPDIILPIRIADEVIGLIVIKRGAKDKSFLDIEDLDYILSLNKSTTEAIIRAYAFEQLEQEVFNKENLIKDINHRVKNNLQMISGLLALQSISAKHEEAKESLDTAGQRISTIAKIHEMLYIRGVVTTINLKDYINEVVAGFRDSSADDKIEFKIDIPQIEVETEKALTICMIVNELVSNSVKYAFKDIDSGTISIEMKKADGNLECIIKDNGRGFTEGSNSGSTGIGHNLVESFVYSQLKGSWDIRTAEGTEHRILIPLSGSIAV